jgi:hypothetical protein
MGKIWTEGQWIDDGQVDPDTVESLRLKTEQLKYQKEADERARQKELQRVADLKAQGLNADGSPIKKDFESLLDPVTGKLKDGYNLDLKTLDPSTLEGYNMLKTLATQEGPSKYAQDANSLAGMKKQDTINAAATQSASAQAQGFSDLAMRGGASAGSRERLAQAGGMGLMDAKQSAYRQNTSDLLNISKTDEEMKRQALGTFATAEGNIANSNLGIQNKELQYNLDNQFKEKDLARSQDFEAYKAALDKWSANKQADAARSSGGSGGKK